MSKALPTNVRFALIPPHLLTYDFHGVFTAEARLEDEVASVADFLHNLLLIADLGVLCCYFCTDDRYSFVAYGCSAD